VQPSHALTHLSFVTGAYDPWSEDAHKEAACCRTKQPVKEGKRSA